MNAVNANRASASGRPSGESGYTFIMAMALVLAVIIGSQVVLRELITEGRREREQETVWRGNQWARAVRLYYHKTGHYPQSIDDLQDGVPDMHFLRASAVKDPMDPNGGSWRFIYVSSTGQIIGSVRYATLQQMALLDLNNGQLPAALPSALPGAVSAASLSSTFDTSSSSNNGSNSGASSPPPANPSDANSGSSSVGGTNGQAPAGNAPPSDSSAQGGSASSGNPGGPPPSQTPGSTDMPSFGQGQSASTFGSSTASALGPNPNPLAQMTQLQPTGPVDGPVPGAFLTGVGIPVSVEQKSIKFYKGAKKYKDWEFIWNPLEDQAQALQQGLSTPTQGVQPGQAQSQSSSAFGPSSTNTLGNPGAPPTGGTNPQLAPPPDQQ